LKTHRSDGKKRYRVRSFYLAEDVLSELGERSQKNNATLNATVNSMLEDMEIVLQVRDYSHTICIPDHLLDFLLRKIDEEIVLLYAREKGGAIIGDVLQRSGDPRTFATLRRYLRDGYCRHSNWANYSENVAGDQIKIALTHKRGQVWSRFMKEYFHEELADFFGKGSITEKNFAVVETGLIITLQKTQASQSITNR